MLINGTKARLTIDVELDGDEYNGYAHVTYSDIDGDSQRAMYVPVDALTPIIVAGDRGTAAELVRGGLRKGSLVNDDDYENSLYRYVYVGGDTFLALQNEFETYMAGEDLTVELVVEYAA